VKEYPLLFTYYQPVVGRGFVAEVVCHGRALMVEESAGEWFVYGVEPGGLAESGATPQEAHAFFREAYRAALFLFAEQSGSLTDFERQVARFFAQRDEEDAARWEAARLAIGEGVSVDAPFDCLSREKAERPRGVEVRRRLDGEQPASLLTPDLNEHDDVGLPLAA